MFFANKPSSLLAFSPSLVQAGVLWVILRVSYSTLHAALTSCFLSNVFDGERGNYYDIYDLQKV
jgi:hypothetical protein